jgi:hypothetical protein
MRCEEFRARIVDWADGAAEPEHARGCAACAAELASAREDARVAGEAMNRFAEGVRPDPARRREFIERLGRPRRLAPLAWCGLAAAALLGVAIVLFSGPDPADEYKKALLSQSERRLADLGVSDGAIEDLVALEAASIEEMLASDRPRIEIALYDARKALKSKDVARRAAARRAIRQATSTELSKMAADDPFVRALARARSDERPAPEGRPMASIKNSNTVNGVLRAVEFEQFQNGVVHLIAREGDAVSDLWAHDMHDLLSRHPDLCRRLEIAGSDGSIRIGSAMMSTDSIRRKAAQSPPEDWDAVRFEALSSEVLRRTGDAALAQETVRRIQEAMNRSDLDESLKELRARIPAEARATAETLERAMRRVRRLEIFCEQVRKLGR